MNIQHVRDYNAKQTQKWHEACDKWKPGTGGFPCLGMYLFEKNYGYVASGGRAALWRKTKHQAISDFVKAYGEAGL